MHLKTNHDYKKLNTVLLCFCEHTMTQCECSAFTSYLCSLVENSQNPNEVVDKTRKTILLVFLEGIFLGHVNSKCLLNSYDDFYRVMGVMQEALRMGADVYAEDVEGNTPHKLLAHFASYGNGCEQPQHHHEDEGDDGWLEEHIPSVNDFRQNKPLVCNKPAYLEFDHEHMRTLARRLMSIM